MLSKLQTSVVQLADRRPHPAQNHLLVTRHSKLFVKLLQITTRWFIFFTQRDLKKSWFLFRLLLYAGLQVSHKLLALKPYRKMEKLDNSVLQEQI